MRICLHCKEEIPEAANFNGPFCDATCKWNFNHDQQRETNGHALDRYPSPTLQFGMRPRRLAGTH